MDVGHPSNFERMLGFTRTTSKPCGTTSSAALRRRDVRATIKRVYETRGYLLDPHSAIAYLGLKGQAGQAGQARRSSRYRPSGEVPRDRRAVIGTDIDTPAPLADALARPGRSCGSTRRLRPSRNCSMADGGLYRYRRDVLTSLADTASCPPSAHLPSSPAATFVISTNTRFAGFASDT